MAVLPIVTGADTPVLRTKTKKIEKVTKDILKLIKDMNDTVHEADGVGIASPQVGKQLRICLALINGKMTPLINPEITWRSEETAEAEEGCLSLPGVNIPVTRSTQIVVRFQDQKGQPKELRLENLEARIVQHETDHLEGRLIVDYR